MLLKITLTCFIVATIEDVWAQDCGLPESNPHDGRIVGGSGSMEMSWPWMGSLRRTSGAHSCGATLISNRWAITAAHCVGAFSSIVLGDLTLSTASATHQQIGVTVFEHPEYNGGSLENDVALLRLHTEVTFNDHVAPACLGESETETATYDNCWITGWGYTVEGGNSAPNVLQEAAVDLFTGDECDGFYGSSFYDGVMICAGKEEGGTDTCQGDSGGPMVCENSDNAWELVGITSWGYGCARPGLPGVYTRVSKFGEFISEIMNADYSDCESGTGFYITGEDECDYKASCLDGTDEGSCPGLSNSDVVDIKSTSFPSSYPNNEVVLWLFEATDPSAQIRVNFMNFDLETNYDFVRAGEGWDATDEVSVIIVHTGNVVPEDVVSTGSRMWVRFTSDSSVTKQGFSARISVDGGDGSSMTCSDDNPCTGENEECEEIDMGERAIPGCVCMAGYWRVEGVCTDINECVHPELNTCDTVTETCMNEDGTFRCECKPEYVDGETCTSGGDGGDPNECGRRPAVEEDGKVVGGDDAVEGAWPWIGSLRGGGHVCGATLIDEDWAITAAHCLGYFDRIVLGDLRVGSESDHHQERSLTPFQHPQYEDSGNDHDIALLRLSTSVEYTDYLRPACLATSQSEVTTYTNCYVAGWGALMEGGSSPDVLQEAAVGLFTDEDCTSFYGSRYNPETMICAGFGGGVIDTCQGDSGGPLVCQDDNGQWHLVGVTSWGDGCARPGKPGVYTRVSKYATFIDDIRNYDFLQCGDGSVLLESKVCDYVLDCQDESDEADCEPVTVGSLVTLTSPNHPSSYPNSQDVYYVISAESDTRLHVHFDNFDLENGYDTLEIGEGDPFSGDNTVTTLTGPSIPEDITIDDNAAWLRFVSDGSVVKAGFRAQISVLSSDASFVCGDGQVILDSLVCNQEVNCPDSEDETGCDPLPDGFIFEVESPNFPGDYPNSHTSTHLFIAGSSLSIRLRFHHLDLEDGFDFLTIGHGQDPNENSSIMTILTGTSMPAQMESPRSSLWITFESDGSITKTGVSLTVEATSDVTEPCAEVLRVTDEVQEAGRHQSTDQECGIMLVATDPNTRVELSVTAELDCDAGEYITIQQTEEEGSSQDSQTYCGIVSEVSFVAGDSVTLIDYNLQLDGSGFEFSYNFMDDPDPDFTGCSRLRTLQNGPVSIQSPRYPRNYRRRQRCEFRFVATPGKRVRVEFDDFLLQYDGRCRYDYVEITDFVTLEGERFCGARDPFVYTSESHYLSVYFRSSNKLHYRGFHATVTEVV